MGSSLWQRGTAEAEFITVGIAKCDLANAVGLGGTTGTLGPLHDVDEPGLREFPNRVGFGGKERRRLAEKPLVPLAGSLVVGDRDAYEQIDGHPRGLSGRCAVGI